jgi:hypothetical protein
VFLPVVLCCQQTYVCVSEVVSCVPSCCVMLPTHIRMCVRGGGLCSLLLCYVANIQAHVCPRWWVVFLPVVLCCQHTCSCVSEVVGCVPCCCVMMPTHMRMRDRVVGYVPCCCVMLPTHMRMRDRGAGLCSLLLCYVANTHAH